MKKLLLFLLFFANIAEADLSSYIKLGSGLDGSFGSSKLGAGGYQDIFWGPFDYQLEGGLFSTNSNYIVFSSFSVGISVVTPSGIYAKVFTGPALLTGTDERLSSVLEFNNDFELGLKDDRGISIGIVYKHISNAGLWPPNEGRNWLLLKIMFPF